MDEGAYVAWRDAKLRNLNTGPAVPVIPVGDPRRLSREEYLAIQDQVAARNFAIYSLDQSCNRELLDSGAMLVALGRQFGLRAPVNNPAADGFGLSRIEYVDPGEGKPSSTSRNRYIPYTTRRLNWHTDGYYNDDCAKVRSFILHCVRRARRGGETGLLDPDLLYILMRDEYPELLSEICRDDAFSIPADRGESGTGRPAFQGAVFSIDRDTGALYTRYTQRKRNIHWRDTMETREAVRRIDHILEDGHPALVRLTLEPGQGLLCNNVLHCRSEFEDGQASGRLLYRLRFTQRITPNRKYRHELS